ncbi:hypothetical protein Tco_0798250 [Tanacetum coccineum]
MLKFKKKRSWPGDEWWYYEQEMELLKQMQEEEERLAYEQHYTVAVVARQQRWRQEAEDLERQRCFIPPMNLWEDELEDEGLYSDNENLDGLNYEDAHLAFDREKSPKFNFSESGLTCAQIHRTQLILIIRTSQSRQHDKSEPEGQSLTD